MDYILSFTALVDVFTDLSVNVHICWILILHITCEKRKMVVASLIFKDYTLRIYLNKSII